MRWIVLLLLAPCAACGSSAPDDHITHGYEHLAQEAWDEAIADFDRAIELDGTRALAFVGRGIARHRKGDLAGAVADFDRAIEREPDNPTVYSYRGSARAQAGDLDGAVEDLERGGGEKILIPVLLRRARTRALESDPVGAIRDFERFLQLAPDHPQAAEVAAALDSLAD